MSGGRGEEGDALIRGLDDELLIDERANDVGGGGQVRVRITARLVDVDAHRLVRVPTLPHDGDPVAGQIVALVGAQGGVEKDLGRSERALSAVEAAGHEEDPRIGEGEEVGTEEPTGRGGRVDWPKRAGHGIIDLGGRDDLTAPRPARHQQLPVVKQLHAKVSTSRRAHERGQEREAVRGGVVDLGRVEVKILSALAAGHEDRAVQQQGCARQCAGHVERSPRADRAGGRIVELCRIQSAQRIRATRKQQPPIVQQGRGMGLARSPQRAGCERERPGGRIIDFQRGESVRPVRPACHEQAAIVKLRGRVMTPRRRHGADRGERARARIEQLGGDDREPAIAFPARDQNRAVIEQGRGVAPDGRRQARRKLGVMSDGRVVELGRRERPARGVLAARDEHRAVRQQRGGVPRAGLVQVRNRRPGPGRLSRGWRREAER